MNNMKKFGNILKGLKVAGGIILAIGILYILGITGESDSERYTYESHSIGWLVNNLFIGLSISAIGAGVLKVTSELIPCFECNERRANMSKYKVVIQRNDGGKTEVVVAANDKEQAKRKAIKDVEMLYGKCFVLTVAKL